MRTFESILAASAVLAAVLTLSSSASATPGFPSAIQDELGLAETPHCSLCHIGTPGKETVRTAFGKYLRSRGLQPRRNDSLSAALAAAKGEAHDSDLDGITDIDALKAGMDPSGDQPEYGCVGRIGPSRVDASAWLLPASLLALFFVRARRRASSPRA